MLTKAYAAQCSATHLPAPSASEARRRGHALFALALGSFVIGTSEFASMGILQIFSKDLDIDVSTATRAITAYAFGVLIGAPLVTLAAAHLNRRTLASWLDDTVHTGKFSVCGSDQHYNACGRSVRKRLAARRLFWCRCCRRILFFWSWAGGKGVFSGHDGAHHSDDLRSAACDVPGSKSWLAGYLHHCCRSGGVLS